MAENKNMFPIWTNRSKPTTVSGRDFLGIQNVGNQIMDSLLPGLTGATRHPRFYTFLCWALWKAQDWGAVKNNEEMELFLYKLENIFLYSLMMHPAHEYSVTGIRIGERAISAQIRSKNDLLPLERPGINREPSGFSVVNYRPSMNELGLLCKREADGLVIPTKDKGMLLAAEYEKSIGPALSGLLKKVVTQKHIERKAILKLALVMCPCRLGNFPSEQALLFKLLFGKLEPVQDDDTQRKESLLYILDALASRPNEEDPGYNIPMTAHDLIGSKSNYKIHNSLKDTTTGWAIFQHRAYVQYAITGFWAAFLTELKQAPREEHRVEHVVALWTDAAKTSQILSKRWPSLKKIDIEHSSISALIRCLGLPDDLFTPQNSLKSLVELRKSVDIYELGPGSKLNEESILDTPEEDESIAENPYYVAFTSLILLLVSIGKWGKSNFEEARFGEALDEGGDRRLSCLSLREDLRLRLHMTIPQFLAFCLRKYVVDQHYIFATEKLWGGSDTFHFYQAENGILLKDASAGQWSSANYIDSTLRLLHALDLVDWESKNNSFNIAKKRN